MKEARVWHGGHRGHPGAVAPLEAPGSRVHTRVFVPGGSWVVPGGLGTELPLSCPPPPLRTWQRGHGQQAAGTRGLAVVLPALAIEKKPLSEMFRDIRNTWIGGGWGLRVAADKVWG